MLWKDNLKLLIHFFCYKFTLNFLDVYKCRLQLALDLTDEDRFLGRIQDQIIDVGFSKFCYNVRHEKPENGLLSVPAINIGRPPARTARRSTEDKRVSLIMAIRTCFGTVLKETQES